MNLDAALATFFEESSELLRELEAGLLDVERGAADDETLNAIFRSAHTIKGSAGLFGLEAVVAFTHEMESVLDRVRSRAVPLDGKLSAVLLDCRDHLGKLIGEVTAIGAAGSEELRPVSEKLIAALRAAGAGAGTSRQPVPATAVLPSAVTAAASGTWLVEVRFGADVIRDGMDPLAILRYLGSLGELHSVVVLDDRLPTDDSFDPETCYLGFRMALQGALTRQDIESAFSFVSDSSSFVITPPEVPLQQTDAVRTAVPPVSGHIAPREARHGESRLLRIDALKLERLIDLIGELVMTGAGVALGAQRAGIATLGESAERLSRIMEEVRDSALQLRMVQVGSTLSRFERVVRDVSRELGKDIRLEIEGGETELDKAIVEQMVDPLTHLVRNAMDHGIETSQVRVAQGKPAQGLLRLRARHDAGVVVIEVSDDGAGLDRDRILAKARERNLVDADAELSERDVFSLIFEPGFSTASAITNLSGRGVGMDVVKRNVTALRGAIEVQSQPGKGTTMRIRLPLTCAIIEGFLVGVGRSRFVFPVDMVEECVEATAGIRTQDGAPAGLDLRGQHLSVVCLRDYFKLGGRSERRESVVVVRVADLRIGFIVDELLGEHQTVIKPLSSAMGTTHGVSGSTILADGSIALIVDIATIVADCVEQGRRAA